MRTMIDLPDPLFEKLKAAAANRGIPLKSLIRNAMEAELRKAQTKPDHRVKFPLLPSKEPGTLKLTNAVIEEFLT